MLFSAARSTLTSSLVLCPLLLAAACDAPLEVNGPRKVAQPIVVGDAAPEQQSIVAVINVYGGGMCSGAVVSDRVVLTAKHCVQGPGDDGPSEPLGLRVGIGPAINRSMRFLSVASVVTTPGAYDDGAFLAAQLGGGDIAVITLQGPAGVPAIPMKLGSPKDEKGKPALAVGYGQTASSNGGTKLRADTKVEEIDAYTLFVIGTVCQGDSGGPLLNMDGEIIGVASYKSGGGCTKSDGNWYNRIDLHADMILGAIKKSGDCSNTGAEACDGFDNDCDEQVDEDCLPEGEACDKDSECVTRLCSDTKAGKICTTRCNPLSPQVCSQGFVCSASDSCEGLCVPGYQGSKSFGDECDENEECSSLFCDDPGDGKKRCLSVCRGGASVCLEGEACVAAEGKCGSCLDADRVKGALGQGEPCDDNTRCRSGLCFDDGGAKYCAATCGDDEDCDAQHHCRDGACVRGVRGTVGDGCRANEDCEAGAFCVDTKRGHFCTRTCGDDTPCPTGFGCDKVENGTVCLPEASVVGGSCEEDDDCLSKVCFEEQRVCTRSCASPAACGPGLECVRSSLGSPGACLDPNAVTAASTDGAGAAAEEADAGAEGEGEVSDGDCSVPMAGTTRSPVAAFSLLALLGLTLRRRRR